MKTRSPEKKELEEYWEERHRDAVRSGNKIVLPEGRVMFFYDRAGSSEGFVFTFFKEGFHTKGDIINARQHINRNRDAIRFEIVNVTWDSGKFVPD